LCLFIVGKYLSSCEKSDQITNCCRGGHGRTGTIISIMIGILFNLNSK
jgi:protein-tyrosine phosphatase